MKILMGIDDSEFSGDVLQAVIMQFRPEHIEVRVLHVLQPSAPAPPQMAPGYAPELDDQKKLEEQKRLDDQKMREEKMKKDKEDLLKSHGISPEELKGKKQ